MNWGTMVLQAIRYFPAGCPSASPASLEILDQLALPHRSIYLPLASCEDAWDAIKQMKVRGAPAIAIVAALSLAVELSNGRRGENKDRTARSVRESIWERLEYLKSSRPTAVNLGDAVRKLKVVAEKAEKVEGAGADTVADAYIAAAERMLVDDVKDNEAIGKHGAKWIREHTEAGERRGRSEGELKVMTHCNTGCVGRAGIVEETELTVGFQITCNSWLWHSARCDPIPTCRKRTHPCLLLRDPTLQSRLTFDRIRARTRRHPCHLDHGLDGCKPTSKRRRLSRCHHRRR